MPNRNYQRGRRYEYKVMRDLEECGYHAYRTAGSHGAFDVIAWHTRHTKVLFIQVKSGERASKQDRDGLTELAATMPPCGRIELWEFVERGKPAIVTRY